MKLYVTIPALVAAGLLSACNSSNTIPTSQIDQGIALLATLDEGEVSPVNADDLPDNATMNGYLAASQNIEGGTVYVGDATADFNFASGTLLGSATNFNEYQLVEACASGFEGCTGEQTRALDGSMAITGDITGTTFNYNAFGGLSTEDDDLGPVVANVNVNGSGGIGTLDDKLVAFGGGGGEADIYVDGTLTGSSDLDSLLVLQE
jgi:hypothetical protein